MKIGLFGGTFDPIHLGHLEIARKAHEVFHLDHIYFIPCHQSPHKLDRNPADALQRKQMIESSITDLPWASICTFEIDKTEPSYAYLTAQYFKEKYPNDELFWIFGTDQWNVIEKWTKPNILAQLVTFIVFPRPDNPLPKQGFNHLTLPFDYPISSSDIRDRIKNNQSISDLVPAGAEKVIELEQLYR